MSKDLLRRAEALASKGVQKDDGYRYELHAADIVEYNNMIRELAEALEAEQNRIASSAYLRLAVMNATQSGYEEGFAAAAEIYY